MFARESNFVEELSLVAAHATGIAVDANNERVAVVGGEAREGQELPGERARGELVGALEVDDFFRVAPRGEVGPIALVNTVIIGETLGAGHGSVDAEGTAVVERLALVGCGEDAKEILAAITSDFQDILDALSAVHSPVVVAVVVDRAFPVEEQAILTSLQRQSSIRTLVELIAELRVGIQLKSLVTLAAGDLAELSGILLRLAGSDACQ